MDQMVELECKNEEVEFTCVSFNVPLCLALSYLQTASCTVSG